ncbi:unnamed protein product [Paramecium octaurelia]|uniref:Uncharacterized protein n=1 Tax=Paramecium octaurelia TaxID=43137 RepID=A0A8S1X8R9_PAROT|nr:unnamed protein product [Paramecium octaurelia]
MRLQKEGEVQQKKYKEERVHAQLKQLSASLGRVDKYTTLRSFKHMISNDSVKTSLRVYIFAGLINRSDC